MPDDQEKLSPNSTLTQVLSYVDSPFKLGAIVVMAVLTFGGYLVYENQAFILAAMDRNNKIVKVSTDNMDEASAVIFRETDATAIAFFKVDQILSNRVVVRAYTRQGREKAFDGIDVGLWNMSASNNEDLAMLVSGKQPCGDYLRAQSTIGLWYLKNGDYACRTSAPADVSAFSGQITLIFKGEPSDITKVRDVMTLVAQMIVAK